MGEYIVRKNVMIGYEHMNEIRKKPCICVREGNCCYVLGTFKNDDDAKFFIDKLAKLTGAVRE
jgi:hypothetical protein